MSHARAGAAQATRHPAGQVPDAFRITAPGSVPSYLPRVAPAGGTIPYRHAAKLVPVEISGCQGLTYTHLPKSIDSLLSLHPSFGIFSQAVELSTVFLCRKNDEISLKACSLTLRVNRASLSTKLSTSETEGKNREKSAD